MKNQSGCKKFENFFSRPFYPLEKKYFFLLSIDKNAVEAAQKNIKALANYTYH